MAILDFQEKRRMRKIMYSRITICILFLCVLVLARSTYDIYQKEQISEQEYQVTQNEYDGLQQRQAMLSSEISRLSTTEGVNEEIMNKFSVAKPGQTVVTVIDQNPAPATTTIQASEGFWQKLLDMF